MSHAVATVASPELIRVTVMSSGSRADLALTGFVAVAELVPGLVRELGLLDEVAGLEGWHLVTPDGQDLRGDAGLVDQGVDDGGVLILVPVGADPHPRVYDDLAEAVADAVELAVAPWPAAAGRRTAVVVGLLLLGLGVEGLALEYGDALGRALVGADDQVVRVLLVVMVLAVTGVRQVPGLVVSAIGVRVEPRHAVQPTADDDLPEPIDAVAVRRDAVAGHRVLLVAMSAVGVLLVIAALLAGAQGGSASAVVVAASAALALGSRRHRSGAEAMLGLAAGMAGWGVVGASALALNPGWRESVTALVFAFGLLVLAAALLFPPRSAMLAWAAELAEFVALASLLPLLLISLGVLAEVAG